MSVTEEPAVVVLMRFVITPRDPITALVNQDMKFNLVILDARQRIETKALPLLFFHDKMVFKVIIDILPGKL